MTSSLIKNLIGYFQQEYQIPQEEINCGSCDLFADHLSNQLEGSEILSDAFFYDCYDDTPLEELCDTHDYNSPQPANFHAVGMPSHYWVYWNGRHYDSECPEGVVNLFDLPIMKRFYQKYLVNSID